MYKITGNIVEIFKTIQQTERYKNRIIVIKDESNSYPKEVSFQASNERVDELDLYKKGDLVEITFSIQSNKWKEKYFTSLNIERIIKTNNCGR